MIRALVFDFDGVILESADIKTRAFKALFAQEPPALLKKIIDYHSRNGGVSRYKKIRVIYRDFLKRKLTPARFSFLCRAFSRLVTDQVIASKWVPGAAPFLKKERKNYLFFVISGTPQSELRKIVRARGIASLFDAVLGSPRTKESLLHLLLRKHSLSPREIVAVGDSETDWRAARQNKIAFVWRKSSHVRIPAGYAGPVIPDLRSLGRALKRAQNSCHG